MEIEIEIVFVITKKIIFHENMKSTKNYIQNKVT